MSAWYILCRAGWALDGMVIHSLYISIVISKVATCEYIGLLLLEFAILHFLISLCEIVLLFMHLRFFFFLLIMQDYIRESENLVLLHDQIRDCDNILSQMETLLSGFQVVLYYFC